MLTALSGCASNKSHELYIVATTKGVDMPITDGYSKYVCAGCGKEVFLGKEDKTQKEKWKDRKRVNADAVDESSTLCETCLPSYDALIKQHDKEVSDLFASLKKGN